MVLPWRMTLERGEVPSLAAVAAVKEFETVDLSSTNNAATTLVTVNLPRTANRSNTAGTRPATTTTLVTVKLPSQPSLSFDSGNVDDDVNGEHPDPQLDRSLAMAIAQLYTPATALPKRMCAHSVIERARAPTARCPNCRRVHLFGWLYMCPGCEYTVCHSCRPRFAERSMGSIGAVLEGA